MQKLPFSGDMEHLFLPVRCFTSIMDRYLCIHHMLCLRSNARQFTSSQFLTEPNMCLCNGGQEIQPNKLDKI